jgi:hypothetical protein
VLVGAGAICGALVLCIGVSLMCARKKPNWVLALPWRSYAAVYFVSILIVIVHLYLSGSTLYTQAKGAQNVLVYVYLVLLLPFAVSLHSFENKWPTSLVPVLKKLLLFFFAVLLIIHMIFTLRLAANFDRSSILEPSFFSRVESIHKLDESAFILFEPRKSGDTYLSNLPFAEKRMVSTRHLALNLVENQSPGKTTVKATMVSDLIRSSDVPHIWLLRAEKKERWPSLRIFDYKWTSERLIDLADARVLLFAHDYEQDFGERDVNQGAVEAQTFSYLRHGAAMLYLPSGVGGDLQIILEPRDANGYEEMVSEIQTRLNTEEIDQGLAISQDGKQVMLTASITAIDEPRLIRIARYSGEFWLSVVLDGEQL